MMITDPPPFLPPAISASPPGEPNNPATVTASIDRHLVLSCGEVTSTPPVQYQWTSTTPGLDQLFLTNGIIEGYDGLLYLQLVTQQLLDIGFVFKCQASNNQLGLFVAGFIQLSPETNAASGKTNFAM